MKKYISVALAIICIFALASCGSSSSPSPIVSAPSSASASAIPAPSTKPSETPSAAPVSTSASPSPSATAQTGSGKIGDYDISFKGYKVTKDYDGKPAVVITFSWTNNSDKTISSAAAVMVKVFQNKVQCENAVIMDTKVYDATNYMKDVQPGGSLDVQEAYSLQDTTSQIEVNAGPLISLDNNAPTVTQTYDITK